MEALRNDHFIEKFITAHQMLNGYHRFSQGDQPSLGLDGECVQGPL